VKDDGTALDGTLATILSITSNGYVQVNEELYDGTDMTAKVQALTGFCTPIFKPITITRRGCSAPSLTPTGSRPLIIATPRNIDTYWQFDVDNDSLFTNSEPYLCPVTYSLVDADRNPLSSELAAKVTIDGNRVRFNSNGYDSRTLHLQLKAVNEASVNAPVYTLFDIVASTNQCRTQTVSRVSEDNLVYRLPIY
jgi:hypothetical protein